MIDGFIEILRDWKNKDNNQDEDPTDDIEQNPSVNEEAELAAIKALAGIGNESVNYAAVNMQPYMTPRSIVARRLRAEQDAARNK